MGILDAPENMGLRELVNAIQAQGPPGELDGDDDSYPRLSPSHARQIAKLAKKKGEQIAELQDPGERKRSLSRMGLFELDEIDVGPLLGAGGFSYVYEIQAFHPKQHKAAPNSKSSAVASHSSSIRGTKDKTDQTAEHQRQRRCTLGSPEDQSRSPLSYPPFSEYHPSVIKQQSRASSSSLRSKRKNVITYTSQEQKAREFLTRHAQRRTVHSAPKDGFHQQSSQLSFRSQLSMVSSVASWDLGQQDEHELSSLLPLLPQNSVSQSTPGNEDFGSSSLASEPVSFTSDQDHNCHSTTDGQCPVEMVSRYALKYIKPSLVQIPGKFARAAMDLALETEMMMCLDHPNIVKIRGYTTGGPECYKKNGAHNAYFLIIDKLVETLEDRIGFWRQRTKALQKQRKKAQRRNTGLGKIAQKIRPGGKFKAKMPPTGSPEEAALNPSQNSVEKELNRMLLEKLQVAYDIAAGVEYLHSRRIVYRDCKSSNIGFDIRGDVKLFDFGLSRFMPSSPSEDEQDDTFEMSNVGTKRYSAPEVERKQPYNLQADIYGIGVVYWEMLSMTAPRHAIRDDDKKMSYYEICPCWPQDLQDLVSSMLSEDFKRRPTIKLVRSKLQQIMMSVSAQYAATVSGDDDFSVSIQSLFEPGADTRRRSTFRLEFLSAAEEVKELVLQMEDNEDYGEDETMTHTSVTSSSLSAL